MYYLFVRILCILYTSRTYQNERNVLNDVLDVWHEQHDMFVWLIVRSEIYTYLHIVLFFSWAFWPLLDSSLACFLFYSVSSPLKGLAQWLMLNMKISTLFRFIFRNPTRHCPVIIVHRFVALGRLVGRHILPSPLLSTEISEIQAQCTQSLERANLNQSSLPEICYSPTQRSSGEHCETVICTQLTAFAKFDRMQLTHNETKVHCTKNSNYHSLHQWIAATTAQQNHTIRSHYGTKGNGNETKLWINRSESRSNSVKWLKHLKIELYFFSTINWKCIDRNEWEWAARRMEHAANETNGRQTHTPTKHINKEIQDKIIAYLIFAHFVFVHICSCACVWIIFSANFLVITFMHFFPFAHLQSDFGS